MLQTRCPVMREGTPEDSELCYAKIPHPFSSFISLKYFFKDMHFYVFGHIMWHVELPAPGVKPVPSAVEARSLTHWTIREAPFSSSSCESIQSTLPQTFYSFVSSLPGESQGQRSLVGYSLWGRRESDTPGRLSLLLV